MSDEDVMGSLRVAGEITVGDYALLQGSSAEIGRTFLNSPVDVRFRINNADRMVVANNGNVGVNIGRPSATLHVSRAMGWRNLQRRVTHENAKNFSRIAIDAAGKEFHLAVGGPNASTPDGLHAWSNSPKRNVLPVSSNNIVHSQERQISELQSRFAKYVERSGASA